jgi:hypothetical protein
MRTILSTLAALFVLTVCGLAAEIKSTTKLTVIAPGATRLIGITDAAVLRLSNVYAGEFIGQAASTPDATLTRYTITFDIQTLDGVKTGAYAVQYCVDKTTGVGFVYLPGSGDPQHRRNISTILREGQDGTWRRASGEWSAAIQPYLR